MTYTDEGQVVWAPFPELGGWLRCTVQAAMGDTARVVNEKRNIDTWFHVDELRAEKPVPTQEHDMNYDDDETAADIQREARRDVQRDPVTLERGIDPTLESVVLRPDDSIVDEEITIYSMGLVSCLVCVPAGMDREVIERRVNISTSTGVSSRWQISSEATFASGKLNPTPCDQNPARLHYLLTC